MLWMKNDTSFNPVLSLSMPGSLLIGARDGGDPFVHYTATRVFLVFPVRRGNRCVALNPTGAVITAMRIGESCIHSLNGECICQESPSSGELCPFRGEQFTCPCYNCPGSQAPPRRAGGKGKESRG